MTKKDFELIANTLRSEDPRTKHYPDMTDWEKGVAGEEWNTTVLAFADALATTNPRFDRARFLAACGVQS